VTKKIANIVSKFIYTNKNHLSQKQQKMLSTQEYLASHRDSLQPQTPLGFKSRTGSSYFLTSSR